VFYNPPEMLSVLVESTYLDISNPNVVQVDFWLVHEGYNASDYFIHDVAVVKLKEPLKIKLFDWKVKFAMKGSYYPTGTRAVLAGMCFCPLDFRSHFINSINFIGWGRNAVSPNINFTIINHQVLSIPV
jgi:hypothetical protein